MGIISKLKPTASKRELLFIAAFFWTFAGMMLLYRGITMPGKTVLSRFELSLVPGLVFYIFLFSRISLRHIQRITNLENESPCLFSFFSIRSYLMMFIMISAGILLRVSGIIRPEYLSLLYIIMGVPLLLSAIRFYWNGIKFHPSSFTR